MRHPQPLRTKSKTHQVTPLTPTTWRVVSGATGNEYTVWRSGERNAFMCSCDWAQYRPSNNNGHCGCSHVLAVIAQLERETGRSTQVYNNQVDARRQHRRILDIGDGLLLTTRLDESHD